MLYTYVLFDAAVVGAAVGIDAVLDADDDLTTIN